MPTVIQPGQVPRELVRPKWYADAGYAQGVQADKLLQAIVKMMTGDLSFGPQPGKPNPQMAPGQGLPGASVGAPINPGEGIRPPAPPVMPQQNPPPYGPVKWGFGPSTDSQLKQLQLGQTRAYTDYLRGQTPGSGGGSQVGLLDQLEDAALSGDEDAIAAYRYFKKTGLR